MAQIRSRLVALIVACALLMQNLDSTIVSTALPQMARAFGADPISMSLALTSYLISLTVFIPASGWMADRFGARRVFATAILVFTLASVLCGQAHSLAALVASRLLQGAGGAMMVPVGRLVLLRTVPKSELVAAMAWLSLPALLGPVLGPPVGGLIVTYASWRWVFDINVPLGVLGVGLVWRFVPDTRDAAGPKLDALGLGWSGLGLSALLFGLEMTGRGALTLSALLFALAAFAAVAYWRHGRGRTAPLLDFSLFRIPSFGLSVLSGSLFRIGVGAMPYLLPLLFQVGFGDSAARSGAITFVAAAGAMLMKPAAPRALRRFGFRRLLVSNGAISAVMLAACALFRPGSPALLVYGLLLLGGFFRSLQFTAFNTVAFADIPPARMSAATSLYSLCQQLTLTLGITTGALGLRAALLLSGHAHPHPAEFSVAFIVVGVISALAVPVAARLSPNAGAEMSGHSRE